MMINHKFLLSIRKDEKGSFTIEASLVFPMIFILTITFILTSLYIYQKVTLYYTASLLVERAAYNWDNPSRDPITSDIKIGTDDIGLYWRIEDDRILDLILSNTNNYNKAEIVMSQKTSKSLPEQKMLIMANTLPQGVNGKFIYENKWIKRKLTAKLTSPLKFPAIVSNIFGNGVSASASAEITEPVEFIRSVELIRTYSSWIMNNKDTFKNLFKKNDSGVK